MCDSIDVKRPEQTTRETEHRLKEATGKIPWRRKWQPTSVLLPGKSHGQGSLVGYSPCGHKRLGHDLAMKQQLLGTFGKQQ